MSWQELVSNPLLWLTLIGIGATAWWATLRIFAPEPPSRPKPPRQMCSHNVPYHECYQCSMPKGGSYDTLPNLADPRFLGHPEKSGPRVYTEAEKQQIAFVDAYLARSSKQPTPRPEPSTDVWRMNPNKKLPPTPPLTQHPWTVGPIPHYRCAYCGRSNSMHLESCPGCGAMPTRSNEPYYSN
jgi:hypothetical protein